MSTLRLLIVEDSEDDTVLLVRELGKGGYDVVYERVETRDSMKAALDRQWDLVIADYMLPVFSGLAALKLLQDSGIDLPFVIVSGHIGEDVAVSAMKAGAHDYIVKGKLKRLVPAVERELRDAEVRRERRKAEIALREMNENLEQLVTERTAELREKEARLNRSQEIAHLGGWELDLVQNRLTWSDEVYRIFGLKAQEFGATYEAFLEAVHPDDRTMVEEAYSGSLREGRDTYEIEHRIVRRSTGETRVVHEKCDHFRDRSGRMVRSVGMVHDITERKHHENLIAGLSRLYAVLSRVNETIVRVRDEQPLFEEVCATLAEVGGFPLVWVGLARGVQVVPVASCGQESDYLKDVRVEVQGELAQGPTGTCVRENRAVINDDFATNPATAPWRESALRHGFHASAAFPVRRQGNAVGAVTLYASEPKTFDAEQVGLLESLSADISYALDAMDDEKLRVRSEEGLREANKRLRLAQQAANAGIWDWDIRSGTLDWSPELFRLFGLDPTVSEASFDSWRSVLHKEDRQGAEQEIKRAIAEHAPLANEYRVVLPSGEARWISTLGNATYDGSGQALRMSGICLDFTEHKRAEQERELSVQFLSTVNESSTKRELIRGAVAFFREQSGCEAVGIRLTEGDDYPYYETHGFPEEFVLLESSLCLRDQEGHPARDSSGYPVMECMCGNVIQGRFDPSKPFFTPHGSFWSNCTTELLATSTDEDRQTRTRNRCNGEGYESVALISLRLGDQCLGLLQLNDRSPGRFTPQQIALYERLVGYLAVALAKVEAEEALRAAHDELEERVRERTAEMQQAFDRLVEEEEEHQRLEAQLRQAQKMEALGTLTGGIAHDFNNILAAIIGFTEIVQGKIAEGSRDKRHLDRVLEAGLRGRELIKRMLAFSRKTDQEKKPILLSGIVTETMKLARSSIPTTINIRLEVRNTSGMVFGDPVQIQQVLLNLCTNAAQAMQTKGGVLYVELSDRVVDESDGGPQRMKPGSYVKLIVRDTGTGISPDIIDKIFDPFFTTKSVGEGTGLGLSVVHGIIHQHDGYILVDSEAGKGSTFTVCLPMIAAKLPQTGLDESALPMGTERVLFVDDEELLAEVGREVLEDLGYEATVITSSSEALDLFRSRPGQFDLVITDATMPEITGIELAREILAARADIPIIMCTGFSHLVDADTAKAAGVRAFAMKPLTKREIAKIIRTVLDG